MTKAASHLTVRDIEIPGLCAGVDSEKERDEKCRHGGDEPGHEQGVGDREVAIFFVEHLAEVVQIADHVCVEQFAVAEEFVHGGFVVVEAEGDEIAEKNEVAFAEIGQRGAVAQAGHFGSGGQYGEDERAEAGDQKYDDGQQYGGVRFADVAVRKQGDEHADQDGIDADHDVGLVVGDGAEVDVVAVVGAKKRLDGAKGYFALDALKGALLGGRLCVVEIVLHGGKGRECFGVSGSEFRVGTAASCKLLAASYWLQAASLCGLERLLASGFWLQAAGLKLQAADRLPNPHA